ncbi:MAG TPA: NHLP family bacteriocin export ABC transporter peptidase/permease/ATPase subunit [bacterium]|nr:NHLP family bacteriocin export ABC transporter peptidase/permease/ATPase subunit [bacterium]
MSTGTARRPARVKTPTVLQMEAVECGAACLAMVLAYYGRYVPLDELRAACGVSRDGSNAANMYKAAAGYGLVPHAYRKEPDELRELRPPLIVFWNFVHFVVVDGFGRGLVYLNDPAAGPRTVTDQEFDEAFTGIALAFDVGPGFAKSRRPEGLARTLAGWLAGSRADILYAVLAGLCLVVPGLLAPTFVRIFVDRVLLQRIYEWTPSLLTALALTAAATAALTWMQQRRLLRLGQRLMLASAGRFVSHVLRLPMEFFAMRYVGDIAARLQIPQQIGTFLSSQLALVGLNIVVIVFYGLLMVRYSVALTVIGAGLALLNFVALRLVSRVRIDTNMRLQQDQGKLLATAFGGLQTIETLKATGGEDDFFARWAGFLAKVVRSQQELGVYTQYLLAIPALLAALAAAAILGVGGALVMTGGLTIGALIAFQYLLTSFTEPITHLVTIGSGIQELDAGLRRLGDVMRNPADPALEQSVSLDGGASARLSGRFEMRGVSFGYSRLAPPLITDFDLSLAPGARVAIVGATGSGKSTVANLIAGLYRPWSGEILFDGRPASAYPRRSITASLAYVNQDIFLYEGSVRDNLTLWDPTLSDATLVGAAHSACIHDEIMARPGGYDSHLEENGANFSGGERQRLEIARALAGDPSILVLDEATSALDPATEKAIDDHLRRRGCTCVYVAHRLSTIRDCDEIIVLEQGQVVQRGTHDTLTAAADGAYARLIATE